MSINLKNFVEEIEIKDNEEELEDITYTEAKPMVHLTVF